jgi:[acyl-carrier-protein] S-malonyltransferase
MRAMRDRGLHSAVECGPGKVLSKILVRTQPDMKSAALFDPVSLGQVKEMLK